MSTETNEINVYVVTAATDDTDPIDSAIGVAACLTDAKQLAMDHLREQAGVDGLPEGLVLEWVRDDLPSWRSAGMAVNPALVEPGCLPDLPGIVFQITRFVMRA